MSLLTFIHASAHDMPQVADGSVQMIATSPPYYGLRKYAGAQDVDWPAVDYAPMPGLRMEWVYDEHAGEWVQDTVPTVGEFKIHVPAMRCPLGNEPTLEAYIAHLVLCLREWRRVLRDDGIAFVNLGDSFANDGKWGGATGGKHVAGLHGVTVGRERKSTGLKPKDLMMVPARFALAAQADGWFLRSDMIGAKVAPMPESVTDRPTRSHEHIFMLTKRAAYFCDMVAVADGAVKGAAGSTFTDGKTGVNGMGRVSQVERVESGTRNMRDVIEWRPQGFSAAHFATWPEAIPERLIRMGTSERGACPHCGAAWRRVVEREANPRRQEGRFPSDWRANVNGPHAQGSGSGSGALTPTVMTVGWQPSCTCAATGVDLGVEVPYTPGCDTGYWAPSPVPCVVLDPFSGSGTTPKVAARLGRRGVGVDISQEYLTDITAARMGDGFQMEMIR